MSGLVHTQVISLSLQGHQDPTAREGLTALCLLYQELGVPVFLDYTQGGQLYNSQRHTHTPHILTYLSENKGPGQYGVSALVFSLPTLSWSSVHHSMGPCGWNSVQAWLLRRQSMNPRPVNNILSTLTFPSTLEFHLQAFNSL